MTEFGAQLHRMLDDGSSFRRVDSRRLQVSIAIEGNSRGSGRTRLSLVLSPLSLLFVLLVLKWKKALNETISNTGSAKISFLIVLDQVISWCPDVSVRWTVELEIHDGVLPSSSTHGTVTC